MNASEICDRLQLRVVRSENDTRYDQWTVGLAGDAYLGFGEWSFGDTLETAMLNYLSGMVNRQRKLLDTRQGK